jgi:serine protease Do
LATGDIPVRKGSASPKKRPDERELIVSVYELKILNILFILLVLSLPAYGEIVTYVDKEGVIHITDLLSDRPLGVSPKPTGFSPKGPPAKNEPEPLKESPSQKAVMMDLHKKGTVSIKTNDGIGSGFLFTPSGHILTNSHVIKENRFVQVLFHDGTTKEAYVVKNLPDSDIALIKVQGEGYSVLTGSVGLNLKEGDEVFVIGSPQGLHYSVTQGIISSLRKIMVNGKKLLFIQTDAPVSRGNSGSPLIRKADGKVIGMITFKFSGQGVEGLGFALAFEEIKKLLHLESIISN